MSTNSCIDRRNCADLFQTQEILRNIPEIVKNSARTSATTKLLQKQILTCKSNLSKTEASPMWLWKGIQEYIQRDFEKAYKSIFSQRDFEKTYKSIFSASKNLCTSPQRQTWWPFQKGAKEQNPNACGRRAEPFPAATLYKPNLSTRRGDAYVIHGLMGLWNPHHPFPDRGAALCATQIQTLTKPCSQFLFPFYDRKDERNERHGR